MSLFESIERKLENAKDEKSKLLWKETKEIVKDTIEHIKNINSQMNLFDIHDEEHSKKILEIEELLLREKINSLSYSELILLYLSAYLHDSAMALPSWEYLALESVEGTDKAFDNSVRFAIRNDLKPIHEYSDIRRIVIENKEKLFVFDQAKNYIFSPVSEEEIIEDITNLILEYENFRSGYYNKLKEKEENVTDYIEYSKKIRIDYIRQFHHIHVEKNARNLIKKYKSCIGELQAKQFTDMLASICRAHGESIEYLKNLPTEYVDYNDEKSNIQFIALLLRLGDILHFEADRAPISLYAEKQINDSISRMHWISKAQEVKCKIDFDCQKLKVKFTAYCKKPEIYYFVQEYIDLIDEELQCFYQIKNQWQAKKLVKYDCYDLPVPMDVDRSGLSYDSNIFIPDRNMKFTLNQAKILELLTGIQLYKDVYLCLRELYQNALDASKCMLANNMVQGITQELPIVFGLGEETIEGVKQKYIYCLDHGIGMSEHIIKNYLLQIGTSFYRSKDFYRSNATWNNTVVPTSQFGIGLLSGFMLADKIGVTTVYYETGISKSCVIRNNEYFYYKSPQRMDIDKIGNHGTLIKLYLKAEYSERINNLKIDKLPIILMSSNNIIWKDYISEEVLLNNLQYIIVNNIGIAEDSIPVLVEDDQGRCESILSSVNIFDYRNYNGISADDMERLYSNFLYLDGINPYRQVIENREDIVDYVIKIHSENVEIFSHIALPRKGNKSSELRIFDYCHFIGNKEGSIYVDGVYVEKADIFSDFARGLGRGIIDNSIINFIGSHRPVLSIDRNSIISLPKIDDEVCNIKMQFITQLIEIVEMHIAKEEFEKNDSQLSLIFDILFRKFSFISNEIIRKLSQGDFNLDSIADTALQKTQIQYTELLHKNCLVFNNFNFRSYREVTRQVIIGRLLEANQVEVKDNTLKIEGNAQSIQFPFSNEEFHTHYNEISLYSAIVKADKWEGEYIEYDIVNSLWPVVSPDLYNMLDDEETKEIQNRIKTVGEYSNSIAGIANIDPVLIYPDIGISSKHIDSFSKKRCYVGVIENVQDKFYLLDFSKHGRTFIENKEAYILYAFYNPRKLNELEEKRIIELQEQKEEYCKGVREGFSILFIGGKRPHYFIKYGKRPYQEMLNDIPESFWEEGITYFNMKGKIVHK